jgi:hypothetical protein
MSRSVRVLATMAWVSEVRTDAGDRRLIGGSDHSELGGRGEGTRAAMRSAMRRLAREEQSGDGRAGGTPVGVFVKKTKTVGPRVALCVVLLCVVHVLNSQIDALAPNAPSTECTC